MIAIIKKELSDYLTSFRGLAIVLLAFALSALAIHAAYIGIRGTAVETGFIFMKLFTTAENIQPDLMNFHTLLGLFFIPFVGIVLGFDAVNSERVSGNIYRVLSQPVYRDQFINAKLIASLLFMTAIIAATMIIVGGLGLFIIGVPPSAEELLRLVLYFITSVIYGAFWVGLALLFSVIFRRAGTSLLVLFAIWIFFSFFYTYMIAPAITNAIVPTTSGTEAVIAQNTQLGQTLMRISPNYVFLEASSILLLPLVRTMGVISLGQMALMYVNPISLNSSLIIAAPYFIAIVGLTTVTLSVGYVLFMRQELRSI